MRAARVTGLMLLAFVLGADVTLTTSEIKEVSSDEFQKNTATK